MKKPVSSIILLFLALSLFSGLQFVGSVSANFFPASVPAHSIEITEDGDITGTDKIQRSGNVYTFTGDVKGTIVVSRSGIVIDGAGCTLHGNGSLTGIWLQEKNNLEVKNLHIRNFRSGIIFTYGWSLEGCTDITLSGNTITDSQYGITFSMFTHNNYILDNTIANNTYGIYITHSPNNTFRNNRLTNNKYNLWISCETSVQMSHFINDIDTSNTINGKPIIYWVREHDRTVPSDAGYVGLVDCTNITVQNQTLTSNSQGILLVATSNSLITKNHVTNNDYGIALFAPYEQCIGNIITRNNITANFKDGIHSWHSHGTIITGNSVTGNKENGINFFESPNVRIVGNAITENIGYGVKLWFHSSNCSIYHNNFVNNERSALADSQPTCWDNGTAGNYWGDYTGVDDDGDGIGDTSYSIGDGNTDIYPLMEPFEVPETEIPDGIPEFPSWMPFLIVLVAVTALAIIYNRRILNEKCRSR
jgi:parallel beta-helix repeat protein